MEQFDAVVDATIFVVYLLLLFSECVLNSMDWVSLASTGTSPTNLTTNGPCPPCVGAGAPPHNEVVLSFGCFHSRMSIC